MGSRTAASRAAMGWPAVTVASGSRGERLIAEGASLADAMAGVGERGIVIHEGRVGAATQGQGRLFGSREPAVDCV